MDDWIRTLLACRRQSEAAVLISVASARGSVPREPGTRMVITAKQQHGTIGGGHLELQAIGIARGLLAGGSVGDLRRFPLGASLGQCCGGLVNLMFEPVSPSAAQATWLDEVERHRDHGEACMLVSGAGRTAAAGSLVVTAEHCSGTLGDAPADAAARALARQLLASGAATRLVDLTPGGPLFLFDPVRPPDVEIVLFGAGHVGQALARILAELPCSVTWVDERADRFPAVVAGNIRIEVSDAPLAEVSAARAGAYFLVMTHSHPLDQTLAEAILRRADFRYFGLIGSLAKRRQFERRLAARGIPATALARMTCPIGIAGIDGKEPAAIAVAVAAELLRLQAEQAAGGQAEAASARPMHVQGMSRP
jgi:xanthine dehydrogenase accessory factor